MEFALDMVHFNPGEPRCETSFLNPEKLMHYGYNGQVRTGINCALTGRLFDPLALPQGSPDLEWILREQENVRREIRRAKEAGLGIYYHIDLMVLPRLLLEKHREALCDSHGAISLHREGTQKLLGCMLRELFQEFPEVDGLFIRVGETYLFDAPYHAGNSPIRTSAYEGSEVDQQEEQNRYVLLLNLLRQQVCVEMKKTLFFRTWDCYPDKFHANPDYYLAVTDRIDPHEKLYFSVKHTPYDFWRWQPLNPCIGIGKHRQIIEIQCQREYEGKGAYPNYIAHGVLDGFPECSGAKGLRQAQSQQICGIFTWSRGGGWYGPYIQNELWCELHSWIFGHWVQDPAQTEQELFAAFCREELGLSQEDIQRFRRLCLTASQAVMMGRYCGEYEKHARTLGIQPSLWMRDDRLGGEEQLRPMLDYLNESEKWDLALAEKAECVVLWEEVVSMAERITTGSDSFREYLRTSSVYGLELFRVIQKIWELYGCKEQGELLTERGQRLLAEYEDEWERYSRVARLPQCATLYRQDYLNLPGTPQVPGIGADVKKMLAAAEFHTEKEG